MEIYYGSDGGFGQEPVCSCCEHQCSRRETVREIIRTGRGGYFLRKVVTLVSGGMIIPTTAMFVRCALVMPETPEDVRPCLTGNSCDRLQTRDIQAVRHPA